MKAYALVQGPRRRVLYMSDSCAMLWTLGAETFEPGGTVNLPCDERAICKANDAYIVRVEYQLGDPITMQRKRKA